MKCKNCEYWKPLDKPKDDGKCTKLGIQTYKLFGCKLHTRKG